MSERFQARLTTIDGRSTSALFDVVSLTPNERFANAGKWLAIFWVAALPFLPIPLVHLVAPPVLIIAGIIAAVRAFGVTQKIASGPGVCPACGAEIPMSGTMFKPRFKAHCPSCGFGVSVELTPAAL